MTSGAAEVPFLGVDGAVSLGPSLVLGICMAIISTRGHRFQSTIVHEWSSDTCEVWQTAKTGPRQDAWATTTSNVIPGHLLQVGLELQSTRISHSLDSSYYHISQLAALSRLGILYAPLKLQTRTSHHVGRRRQQSIWFLCSP